MPVWMAYFLPVEAVRPSGKDRAGRNGKYGILVLQPVVRVLPEPSSIVMDGIFLSP